MANINLTCYSIFIVIKIVTYITSSDTHADPGMNMSKTHSTQVDQLRVNQDDAAISGGTMVAHRQVQQTVTRHQFTIYVYFFNDSLHPTTSVLSDLTAKTSTELYEQYKPRIFGSPCVLFDLCCVTDVYNSTINFTLPWGRGYLFKHLQHRDSYMHGC